MKTVPIVLAALAALAAACSESPHDFAPTPVTPAGYWEGKGSAWELMLNDGREMTRSAETEFWFTLDSRGEGCGEIEIRYAAELNVEIPSAQGPISIAPTVTGEISKKDRVRRYPICARYSDGRLEVGLTVMLEDREPLEFVIKAKANIGVQGPTVPITSGGSRNFETTIKSEMAAFDPFLGAAPAVKRPNGPFVARFEEKTEKYSVEWSARQLRQDD